MKKLAVLNDRQEDALERVGAGAEPETSAEPAMARTVYALRDRGLVEVKHTGKKSWTALLTEAGRFYLTHGYHPGRPPDGSRSDLAGEGQHLREDQPSQVKPVFVWDGRPREHAEALWKPATGTTATFEEFAAARAKVIEIHADKIWNSWRGDERARELHGARLSSLSGSE